VPKLLQKKKKKKCKNNRNCNIKKNYTSAEVYYIDNEKSHQNNDKND
jgi:hypothetical protein